jgi:hypothetical protein
MSVGGMMALAPALTARLKAVSTSGTWRKIDPVVPPSVCDERLRMCGNSSLSMTLGAAPFTVMYGVS